MSMYVAYYVMADMSPDLPVWVEADNWSDALNSFNSWRNRKETEGVGYLIALQPYKVESDKDRDEPRMGTDPNNRSTIPINR